MRSGSQPRLRLDSPVWSPGLSKRKRGWDLPIYQRSAVRLHVLFCRFMIKLKLSPQNNKASKAMQDAGFGKYIKSESEHTVFLRLSLVLGQ